MKRYLLLIAYEPGDWSTASEETRDAFFAQHQAFSEHVAEHGREIASAALGDTDTATTVRHADGELVLTDGPFAETAEMIGGYYEVELPDLDATVAAVALLPPSYAVEIRPVVDIE